MSDDRKMYRARLKNDPQGVHVRGYMLCYDGASAADTGQGWWTVTGTVDETLAFYNREFERGNMVAMNEVPA